MDSDNSPLGLVDLFQMRMQDTLDLYRQYSEIISATQIKDVLGSIAKSYEIYSAASITEALSSFVNSVVELQTQTNSWQFARNNIEKMLQAYQDACICFEETHDTKELCISEDDLQSLVKLSPLVPEEQQGEFREIIHTEPKVKEKILSSENIKFILSIIFSLLISLTVKYLPDPATEEAIHNQEIEISMLEEVNSRLESQSEYESEQNTLLQIGNDLSQEEIDLLKDLINLSERLIDSLESGDDVLMEFDDEEDVVIDSTDSAPDVKNGAPLDGQAHK